ncbi:MAG: putative membrane protein YfcA [Paracoccaceae bacterium]
MDPFYQLMTPLAFGAAFAIAMLAGFVKGTVGFAMPLIMISGMGAFLPIEVALAGLIGATVTSNVVQALRQGWRAAIASARHHWRFLVIVLVCMLFSAQLVPIVSDRFIYGFLGVAIVVFVAMQLMGWKIRVDPARRVRAEFGFGVAAGALGGLAGVWGPPTVAYLLALDTEKTEQVRVQGVVFFLGAIVLLSAHLQSGVLNTQTIPLSVTLIIPAMLGMGLGFRAQERLDREQFLRATLIVLLLAGFNLLRRALF